MSRYVESCYFLSELKDMSVKLHYCEHPDSSHLPIDYCPHTCTHYMNSERVFDLVCAIERIVNS